MNSPGKKHLAGFLIIRCKLFCLVISLIKLSTTSKETLYCVTICDGPAVRWQLFLCFGKAVKLLSIKQLVCLFVLSFVFLFSCFFLETDIISKLLCSESLMGFASEDSSEATMHWLEGRGRIVYEVHITSAKIHTAFCCSYTHGCYCLCWLPLATAFIFLH